MKAIGARGEAADMDVSLGRVLLARDQAAEAVRVLEEAIEQGEELNKPGVVVFGAAVRALAPGGDPAHAERLLSRYEDRLTTWKRMQTWYLLWLVTRNQEHLDEATRLMRNVLEDVEPARRERMLSAVPLFREIQSAA